MVYFFLLPPTIKEQYTQNASIGGGWKIPNKTHHIHHFSDKPPAINHLIVVCFRLLRFS